MKHAVAVGFLGLFAIACSGDDGTNGADGATGHNAIVAQSAEPAGSNCRYGGTAVRFGVDDNGDGTLGDDEVDYTNFDCENPVCELVRNGKCAGADLRDRTIVGFFDADGTGGNDPVNYGNGDLSNIDLSGADLTNAILFGVDFSHANLAGAKLDGVLVIESFFTAADMHGASLKGAIIGASFLLDANLAGADLSNAILSDSIGATSSAILLGGVNATGAKFDHAILQGDIFLGNSDFTGASFVGVQLGGGDMTAPGAKFINVNFTDAALNNFDLSTSTPAPVFTGANFTNTSLFNVNFTGVTLSDAGTFSHAFVNIPGTTLPAGFDAAAHGIIVISPSANLSNIDFTHVKLDSGVDFTNANCTNANFTGLKLAQANFTGTNLTGANLTGTSSWAALAGANLTSANCTDADMHGIAVDNTNVWNGTNFTRANLTGRDLSSSNVTGANFTHTTLIGADLDPVTGGTSATYANVFIDASTDLIAVLPVGSTTITIVNNGGYAGADLSGIWLDNITFDQGTVFTNANFTGARLGSGADLSGSSAAGANFTNARVIGDQANLVNFIAANLAGANFTGAQLLWTNLSDATLTGSNLTNTAALGSSFGLADMTGATIANTNFACTNFVIGDGNIGTPIFGSTTATNMTCPDFTVEASGPANACLEHTLLPLYMIDTPFNLWTTYRCTLAPALFQLLNP